MPSSKSILVVRKGVTALADKLSASISRLESELKKGAYFDFDKSGEGDETKRQHPDVACFKMALVLLHSTEEHLRGLLEFLLDDTVPSTSSPTQPFTPGLPAASSPTKCINSGSLNQAASVVFFNDACDDGSDDAAHSPNAHSPNAPTVDVHPPEGRPLPEGRKAQKDEKREGDRGEEAKAPEPLVIPEVSPLASIGGDGPLVTIAKVESQFDLLAPQTPAHMSLFNATLFDGHCAEMHNTANVVVDGAGFDSINEYTIVREIGAGSCGRVMMCIDNATQEMRAIKYIPRGKVNLEGKEETILREVAVMKKLRHRNVVRLYDCIDDPQEDTVYLVMQYVDGGPLLQFDSELRCSPLPLTTVKKYLRQIASAVHHMHTHGVVHHDIKPQNILVDKDGNIYVTDFGVSEISCSTPQQRAQASCGTPLFFAPEVLGSGGSVGAPADMWAVGVTLYAMVYGSMPFSGQSFVEVSSCILDPSTPRFPPTTPEQVKWQHLIQCLLQKDPKSRMTSTGLCAHPLLHGASIVAESEPVELGDQSPTLQSLVTPKTTDSVVASLQQVTREEIENAMGVRIQQPSSATTQRPATNASFGSNTNGSGPTENTAKGVIMRAKRASIFSDGPVSGPPRKSSFANPARTAPRKSDCPLHVPLPKSADLTKGEQLRPLASVPATRGPYVRELSSCIRKMDALTSE